MTSPLRCFHSSRSLRPRHNTLFCLNSCSMLRQCRGGRLNTQREDWTVSHPQLCVVKVRSEPCVFQPNSWRAQPHVLGSLPVCVSIDSPKSLKACLTCSDAANTRGSRGANSDSLRSSRGERARACSYSTTDTKPQMQQPTSQCKQKGVSLSNGAKMGLGTSISGKIQG
jgi:hypothetical protein